MTSIFTLKKIPIAIAIVSISIALFYVHALGGLVSRPVNFAQPPEFVEVYAIEKYGPNTQKAVETVEDEQQVKLTKDYFNEAALVRNTIVNGDSPDEVIRLFTHPDKATRIKVAFAFAQVNLLLSHYNAIDFDEKRTQFWEKVQDHSADMQNAIFEALIASAEEGTRSYIPYTLAWWMLEQEQKSKATEMLTWASKHHPDPWVRNFSVFFVVQHSGNEELAKAVIQDRTHDPIFRVRKQVLQQRSRRFKAMLFGTNE